MHPFPHRYHVVATALPDGDVPLLSGALERLQTATPAEFDGPGDRWSPETLLTGAVADCFVLTFRGVARASKLEWTDVRCDVTGTLERIDRVTRFTAFDIAVQVRVLREADAGLARSVVEKAERTCLVTRSLSAAVHLDAQIEVVGVYQPDALTAGRSAV